MTVPLRAYTISSLRRALLQMKVLNRSICPAKGHGSPSGEFFNRSVQSRLRLSADPASFAIAVVLNNLLPEQTAVPIQRLPFP